MRGEWEKAKGFRKGQGRGSLKQKDEWVGVRERCKGEGYRVKG